MSSSSATPTKPPPLTHEQCLAILGYTSAAEADMADAKDIRKRMRRLSYEHHPTRKTNPTPQDVLLFNNILAAGNQLLSMASSASPPPPPASSPSPSRQPLSISATLTLSLEDAYRGGMFPLTIQQTPTSPLRILYIQVHKGVDSDEWIYHHCENEELVVAVCIQVLPDPRFTRQGLHLTYTIPDMDLKDALSHGDTLTIPSHPCGSDLSLSLNAQHVFQVGKPLRFLGHGMVRGSFCGDLTVVVTHITFPTKLTPEQKHILKSLW